mmetsp:Transcript_48456/g.152244  ORF Transcript_48456/g.152244 Transcript_48456/m.152244 type:complete len:300 (-) Transcript_48456:322-1221(-)
MAQWLHGCTTTFFLSEKQITQSRSSSTCEHRCRCSRWTLASVEASSSASCASSAAEKPCNASASPRSRFSSRVLASAAASCTEACSLASCSLRSDCWACCKSLRASAAPSTVRLRFWTPLGPGSPSLRAGAWAARSALRLRLAPRLALASVRPAWALSSGPTTLAEPAGDKSAARVNSPLKRGPGIPLKWVGVAEVEGVAGCVSSSPSAAALASSATSSASAASTSCDAARSSDSTVMSASGEGMASSGALSDAQTSAPVGEGGSYPCGVPSGVNKDGPSPKYSGGSSSSPNSCRGVCS